MRDLNLHLPCNIIFKNTISRIQTTKAALEAKVSVLTSGMQFLGTGTSLRELSFSCTGSLWEGGMETEKKLVQTTDAASYSDFFCLSLCSRKIPISLHTQDFPFSQQCIHCFSLLWGGWVWCCELPHLRNAESSRKPRWDVVCQCSKNHVWISQLTCLHKSFHKVDPEQEKSQAEPLGRMWMKSGCPKEGPSEPRGQQQATHLVW